MDDRQQQELTISPTRAITPGTRGRFHHLTYAVDSREEVLRAADICLENGVYIETGPHKHAIQQTFFLTCTSRAEIAWKSPMPARA